MILTKRKSIEIEVDFITSWIVLYPCDRNGSKERIATILNEYMYFITPLI